MSVSYLSYLYFDKAEDTTPLAFSLDMRVAMSTNGLTMLALGVYPGALMALCAAAFSP
jgi:NADH-quinone oxidoreductase subunit N